MTCLPRRIGGLTVALAACVGLVTSDTRVVLTQSSAVQPMVTDFLATAADGRPVRDLKPEDLTLKVDGKNRTIRSVQLVAAGDAPGAGVRTGTAETPPPFDTNVSPRAGRGIMIAIDDESMPIGGERPLREAVLQMASELAPTDRIALATVPHGGLKLDFTSDRAKLQEALATVAAQPHTAASDQDAACQTRSVLQQTAGLLSGLDPASGPTTFVLLTAGLVGPRSDTFGSSSGQRVGAGSIGVCELTPDHFEQVAQAAAEARALFYVAQAEHDLGAAGDPSRPLFGGNVNPQVGLENLAGVTGGNVVRLSTSGANLLGRIARETSAHYLLTFDSDAGDRRAGRHQMDLRTTRADVTLRARPALVVSKGADAASAAARTPRDTLRDAKPYRDLPLRAAAFVSRAPGQKLMIVATVEPIDPAAQLSAVVAGLYQDNKLVAEWTARPQDLASQPIKAGVLAAAGTYRLRVAARDLAGHIGAVDEQVAAQLTNAGSLQLSSLVIGAPGPNGTFTQRLEFSTEPNVVAFFELYGGRTNMQLGATFELAATVTGPALATAVPKWGGTTEPDRFTATAELPIASLAPGDYVVRAMVGLEGQPEGRIVRTLRKR